MRRNTLAFISFLCGMGGAALGNALGYGTGVGALIGIGIASVFFVLFYLTGRISF